MSIMNRRRLPLQREKDNHTCSVARMWLDCASHNSASTAVSTLYKPCVTLADRHRPSHQRTHRPDVLHRNLRSGVDLASNTTMCTVASLALHASLNTSLLLRFSSKKTHAGTLFTLPSGPAPCPAYDCTPDTFGLAKHSTLLELSITPARAL